MQPELTYKKVESETGAALRTHSPGGLAMKRCVALLVLDADGNTGTIIRIPVNQIIKPE